ncbi:GntR family transcriptional regulator [Paracoccus pacificus]|uniref:GntR family transcriptional regulator n=1 Tax=Paracoccus pacificus TaxID=1463598 RepID=A0ABW4R4J3_9RHOB
MSTATLGEPAPLDPQPRIARHSLHDAIVIALRDMIIKGDLPPGTRINEGQIGAQLGVSRTPLREAIKFVASEGLIELVPSRGAIVKKFTAKEVRDTMYVLRRLEQMAAVQACAIASDEGIARIRTLHDRMIDRYRHGDRLAYYKLNQDIHTATVALADNAALSDVHALLQTRLKRIRFVGHEGPEKWANAVAEHEQMMAAFEARDAEKLAEVIGRHLDQAWERVKDSLPD